MGYRLGMRYIPQPLRRLKRRLLRQPELPDFELLRKQDGEREIIDRYRTRHKRELDLANPTTYSEKMYRRMVEVNRNGNPLFTRLADKLLVRDYIEERVGGRFLTPLLWSGANPKKIPFDRLPAKCIAKVSHASARNLILKQPIDSAAVISQLSEWLKQNHYWAMREGHYYDIEPQILIEGLLDDEPLDYRFWCFGGTVELIQIDNNTHTLISFYDRDWNRLAIVLRETGGVETDFDRPSNLDEMIQVSSSLSRDFDFVRVDLYSVHGKTYVGEMTFMPSGGMFRFKPEYWESFFGEKWKSKVDSFSQVCTSHRPRWRAGF